MSLIFYLCIVKKIIEQIRYFDLYDNNAVHEINSSLKNSQA